MNKKQTDQDNNLPGVRRQLLKGMLMALMVLGLPAVVISCIEAIKLGQLVGAFLYGGIYLFVFATTLYFHRLPFVFCAGVMLASLYMIAVFNFFQFSFSGAGIEIAITISVLATVLLGIRSGLITAVTCLFTLITIGICFVYGAIDVSPEMPATTTKAISWVTAAAVFTLLTGSLILSSGRLQGYLIKSLDSLRYKTEELKEVNKVLTQEIKQREMTEAKLKQSEAQFRTLFEAAPDAIYLADLEGTLLDGNRKTEALIGSPREAFIGKNFIDAGPKGPLHDDLNQILKAGRRATDITRQLLAFARKQTIAPVVLDLNGNVENMLKMIRRLIGEDIDLVWMPGKDLGNVKMDPSQIDQIMANLCVNARDAIEGVGRITIETENIVFDADYCADHLGFVPGRFVLLTVSDNGCGMDKEILNNIFEPFFTTKPVDKGTGLGLSTIYGIVKQNNGFINVYSEPGKGTAIKIYLPLHEDKAVGIQRESTAKIPQGYGETILVVEDDLSILKLAEKILKGLNYTVLIADTPKGGIKLAEDHTGEIHLLVTDVVMPEMNGLELSKQLKLLYPDLKCMFMSGYTANAIAHHGVLDKGVHFIQKPFSKRALAIIVRKILDRE